MSFSHVFVVVVLSVFILPITPSSAGLPNAVINTNSILTETDPKFLSIALDAHIIQERWKNFNFSSKRALNLASHLSPAYLRLGGTAADLVIFKEKTSNISKLKKTSKSHKHRQNWRNPKTVDAKRSPQNYCYRTTNIEESAQVCEDLNALYAKGNFTLTGLDWMNINEFAKKAGLTLLFDFNVLLRNNDGSWNSQNAKEILTFSSEMGYKDIAWELGNEPNSLQSQLGFNLSGLQLGKDNFQLKKLLSTFPLYQNSTLVGPDINQVGGCTPSLDEPWPENATFSQPCPALQYLEKVYLGSRGVLDAFTWHHYYMAGAGATDKDFVNPRNLDNMVLQFEGVQQFLKNHGWDQTDVWLGETASGYDGGTFGLSNRYASGLLWLNKLGLAAMFNYKVVIRQTFYHGCYAMIGEDGIPNPDFWISALYKKIVSPKVLNVTCINFPPTFKLYGHCTSRNSGMTGVTLFGVNMSNQTIEFQISNSSFSNSTLNSFIFTPQGGNLSTRNILLNGKLLQLTPGDSVPEFEPVMSPTTNPIVLPGYGMGFWLLPDITLDICKN